MSRETECPVCGFDLGFKPWDGESASDEICPSCGIQFGYDDAAGSDHEQRKRIHDAWREKWIAKGMPWSSVGMPSPPDWNPEEKLRHIPN